MSRNERTLLTSGTPTDEVVSSAIWAAQGPAAPSSVPAATTQSHLRRGNPVMSVSCPAGDGRFLRRPLAEPYTSTPPVPIGTGGNGSYCPSLRLATARPLCCRFPPPEAMFTPMLPVAPLTAPAPSEAAPLNEPTICASAICVLSSVATSAPPAECRPDGVEDTSARLLFWTLPRPEATLTPTLPVAPASAPSPTVAARLKLLIVPEPMDVCCENTCALPNTLPLSIEASEALFDCALTMPLAVFTPPLPVAPCSAPLPIEAVEVPGTCVFTYSVTLPWTRVLPQSCSDCDDQPQSDALCDSLLPILYDA